MQEKPKLLNSIYADIKNTSVGGIKVILLNPFLLKTTREIISNSNGSYLSSCEDIIFVI